ncbi:hypothetical protein WME76_29105 [Sorangium sp. So ce119]|uniref:hypothetical protein n=1 Tax=Sorangium sp. So ce119 TaxID=3133279 RepID=UPI003F61F023
MRSSWNLSEQLHTAPNDDIEHVLVEYNGPQVVTLRDAIGVKLAVASDEDESCVRWVQAYITETERKALFDGALTIRDALLKDVVFVVDVSHDGRPLRSWDYDPTLLTDADLPKRGALLPRAVREEFAQAVPEFPELRLDGGGVVRSSGVAFRALSSVLDSFQRLWNAIAQSITDEGPKERGRWPSVLANAAELSLGAAGHGSLVLHVSPSDEHVFNEVAKKFESLANAGDDPAKLSSAFAKLGPRVQSRYGELLGHLQKQDLQLLTRWPSGSAFVSGYAAARVLSAFPRGQVGKPRTVKAVGTFLAFDSTKLDFEFTDESSDDKYEGRVDPEVLETHASVAVGRGSRYVVTIEVQSTVTHAGHLHESNTLRSISPMDGTEGGAHPSPGTDAP